MNLILRVKLSIKIRNTHHNGALVEGHHPIRHKHINGIKPFVRVGHTMEEFCVPITFFNVKNS